jgi:pimeloyl-ACP methyl ester carboxylesterase
VLVSPYLNMTDLAHEQYPWVPAWVLRTLLRYPLQTDARLPGIKSPVLLVHGGRDALIPPSHTERLHALAPRSQVLMIPQAEHGDIHEFPAYLEGLAQALTRR